MAFPALLLALFLALASLICSVYFQNHAGDTAITPLYITWITLSAATTYVLLCFVIIALILRGQQQQHNHSKHVEDHGYRISRRSNDTDTPEVEEAPLPAQRESRSTFYYCNESFAAVHLNSELGTPRTPETVLRHPRRSSTSFFPLPLPPPAISPKLRMAEKLNLAVVQAVKVDVGGGGEKKGWKGASLSVDVGGEKKGKVAEMEILRREILGRILRATERRSAGVKG